MKLYNSFTNKKEEFVPINKNEVKIYVCGQTTYDYCHLGHARKEVVFDMIRRWLIALGYQVTYVENITDIDDKIINRAIENNESITDLTNRYINYMHEDFDKLGIMRPDVEPRATDYIPQMVNIIDSLINKGYAYKADNGDVYYSVKKFKDYGKLSGKLLEDLNIGERVDIELHKQNPMDFVLWKAAKNNEPYWESSLGNGRPGWHIECSAMSEEILGKNFDIHGGGQDLQFPHHENEIAQSEAHNGCKFANYWIHNGFLNINDEKMSKSLGNFLTLREVLSDHNPEVIKLLMLKTHYRSPLNFNYSLLEDAKQNLTKLYLSIKTFSIDIEHYKINWENEFAAKFKNAMNDDFNTPLAIGILFELTNSINISKNEELAKLLISLANMIGILNYQPLKFLQEGIDLSNIEIEKYISIRDNAKNNKNYELADEIRNKLQNQGILLEDNVNGTSWRKI
jgi:cysteinyl-tRNA synthetase